jgi:hypothetical protein
MVTATGTVVGDAPPGCAGVVGGLKQTAMNIGPSLGIAVAAGATSASAAPMSRSLVPLAFLALLGLIPAFLLPGHADGDANAIPPSRQPAPDKEPVAEVGERL